MRGPERGSARGRSGGLRVALRRAWGARLEEHALAAADLAAALHLLVVAAGAAAGPEGGVLRQALEGHDPDAFRFLLCFARDNELKMRPGRKQKRPDEEIAGSPPAIS